MEVILLEKMGKTGDVGDKITVKAGYARNYLFPYAKAIPATRENVATFEARKDELLKKAAEKLRGEQKRAALLRGIVLTIEANASDDGKLYGSVGTREIANAASAGGHDIDKSEVELPEGPLQQVGEYEITIHLSPEVSTEIKVIVASAGTSPDAIIEPDAPADDPAEGEESTTEERGKRKEERGKRKG